MTAGRTASPAERRLRRGGILCRPFAVCRGKAAKHAQSAYADIYVCDGHGKRQPFRSKVNYLFKRLHVGHAGFAQPVEYGGLETMPQTVYSAPMTVTVSPTEYFCV